MDPRAVLDRIAQSAAAAGMPPTSADLAGNTVLVARRSDFRLRWMATRLHTFLVASAFPPGTATADQLDRFLHLALDHAVANKSGLPRGLQTGVAVVAVAVTTGAGPEAAAWASSVHGRRWAAIPFPVLVDGASGQVVHPKRMVIGGIYASHLRRVVTDVVAPALGGPRF
ncbi:MAG TPA: hypothetical protein VFM27_14015 [Acidimicrobiales bacterium]|nr:hypothetical protein [Acidimicrobiales bacterium]